MQKGRKKNIKITPKISAKAKKKDTEAKDKKIKKTNSLIKKKSSKVAKKIDVKELLEISREWNKEEKTEDFLDNLEQKKENSDGPIPDEFYTNDKDKRLMMWAGVTFFMVVILFFWVINIKKTFKAIEVDNSKNDYSWLEIKDEFNGVIEEVKEGMEEIKAIEDVVPEENELKPGLINKETSKEEIVDLKNRLEEIERKIDGAVE